MNKKYIYALIGIFVTGQATVGFYGVTYETKKIQARIESAKFEQINKKIESEQKTKGNVTKVTYKYKKKKSFEHLETSITNMKRQNKYFGTGSAEHQSQPAKIAKVLSGKLLISR